MAMELRHLRYFLAVAEEGHISRAAERLGIAQPPLSKQIHALENELSVQLFRRKPRGVELTAAGAALFDQTRLIFAQLERATAVTRQTARGEQGGISLGLTGAAIFHPLVLRAIREFRRMLPLVSVLLEEGNPFVLLDRLEKSEIDGAFVRTPVADRRGIWVIPLLEEPMVVAVPSAWTRSKRRSANGFVRIKDLAQETFVDYGRPHAAWPWLRHTVHSACRVAGFNPRIGQHAPEMVSAVNLVAAGLGIAIVPASLQRMNIDGVSYLKIEGSPKPTAPLNLVTRRTDLSSAMRRFLTMTRSMAKSGQTGQFR